MRSRAALAPYGLAYISLALCACNGKTETSPPAAGPSELPTVTEFAPDQVVTSAGRSVRLHWTVSGASTLRLQPGAVDVTGRSDFVVTPNATTSYTLEAVNDLGTAQQTTQVRLFDWSATASVLDGFVASSGPNTVTGYTFIVFDRSGVLYSRAGGDQTADTARAVASATKLPSVAAILTLVDEGRLDLDAPVQRYLAADSSFVWPADKAAITMRMLLAHTSGLVGLNDTQPDCLSQPLSATLQSCAQDIANTDLVAAPGGSFNYGGDDFQVAGYIATLISGQSWQDFFAARVGTPVGMSTFSYGPGSNPRIAGGAVTNVADYARFLQMIQNGGKVDSTPVLSTAMVAELKKNQIAGVSVAYTPFPSDRAASYPGYGLGVFISDPALYAPSKGPEFSDPGLFGAIPWFDENLGYGAMLLVTDTVTTGLDMWDAVRPTIVAQYLGTP